MNTSKVKYLLLFLFSLITATVSPQKIESSQNTREFCQKLTDEAQVDLNDNKYPHALEKLLKAELIAGQNQWNDLLWNIKNRIGRIYYDTSGFGEALSYYQQALAITEKDKQLSNKSHFPLNSIAVLYGREGKYVNSLEYFKKAYDIVKNEKGSSRKKIACNMAEVYIKTGEIEKGLKLLNEVKSDEGSPVVNFLWQSIYIKALIANGQISEAQKIAEPVYAELTLEERQGNIAHCFVCIAGILSEIYEKSNEIDKAILPAKEALLHTEKLSDHVDFYEIISSLYLQKGEYKTALLYKDSASIAKDSLTLSINRSQYEISKVRFKVSEYQNELIKKKEQQRKQKIFFIITVIFILIIFFFIYRRLIRKNRILAKQEKVSQEYLKKFSENQDGQDYSKLLEMFKKNDPAFISYFDETFPDFSQKLLKINHKIIQSEIEFCALLKLKIPTKEIARYRYIEPKTVRNKKYLLRIKLNIPKEVDIYQWFDNT